MRTREEIMRALVQLRDAFAAASYLGDQGQKNSLSVGIMALRWAIGCNDPQGFGEMIALMEAEDVADQLIEHSVN